MQRLRIKAFYEWAQKSHANLLQRTWAAMDNVSSEITSDNFNNMLLAPEFIRLLELFDEFCKLDQVAVDQTIEQTLNHDSKMSGGIVGISLNQGEVQHWVLTAHDRTRILQICRMLAGMYDAQNQHHKETSSPCLKKDEGDIKKVMDMIESWVNPFEMKNTADSLINIAPGVKATDDITEDILSAEEKGANVFSSFVQKRLCSSQTDFYSPLAKTALETFRNLVKSKKTKGTTTDIVIKADRGLFAKMVVIAQHRQMNMKEVLQYPLGPQSWPLATPDGAPAKTTKTPFHIH
ncbi:Hypothetical predicted protein [Octopus vulgaris]|uniref:Uncharacterized protein n=1 Tax=Octopus vulgaris TaxID=6645 RepID=A0AA36BJ43_OCTVU|nr:Hypothetical predicted protein [Octopus vulgaris]